MRLIWDFLKSLFWRIFKRGQYKLRAIEEAPENPACKVVYVIGKNGNQWHLFMACPCGCGAKIYLNLLPDDSPRWKLILHSNGAFSLSPSIWRTEGCRSHFFIRQGRIEWCGKQGMA